MMHIVGVDLLTIALALGHRVASQSVTGIYARANVDAIRGPMETAVRAMLRKGELIPEGENVIAYKQSM